MIPAPAGDHFDPVSYSERQQQPVQTMTPEQKAPVTDRTRIREEAHARVALCDPGGDRLRLGLPAVVGDGRGKARVIKPDERPSLDQPASLDNPAAGADPD